jgi:hypothetical protein
MSYPQARLLCTYRSGMLSGRNQSRPGILLLSIGGFPDVADA